MVLVVALLDDFIPLVFKYDLEHKRDPLREIMRSLNASFGKLVVARPVWHIAPSY